MQTNILHYLEETRLQCSLMPTDVIKRAKVREIYEVIASGIQPLQNVGVLARLEETNKLDWAQYWIIRGLNGTYFHIDNR